MGKKSAHRSSFQKRWLQLDSKNIFIFKDALVNFLYFIYQKQNKTKKISIRSKKKKDFK